MDAKGSSLLNALKHEVARRKQSRGDHTIALTSKVLFVVFHNSLLCSIMHCVSYHELCIILKVYQKKVIWIFRVVKEQWLLIEMPSLVVTPLEVKKLHIKLQCLLIA